MILESVYIYGTGGHAAEASWLIELFNKQNSDLNYVVEAFIDDHPQALLFRNKPVLNLAAADPSYGMLCALGMPHVRQLIVDKCEQAGFGFFPALHAPNNMIAEDAQLAAGVFSYGFSTISTNVCVARHVHINKHCQLSHDVQVGEFTTLSPGSNVCGNVIIGKRVFIGAGATIINGTPHKPLIIGDDAVIAAGACVINNVAAYSRVYGVPAKLK